MSTGRTGRLLIHQSSYGGGLTVHIFTFLVVAESAVEAEFN